MDIIDRETDIGKFFVDTLESLIRLRWYNYGPSDEDESTLLYFRFHSHPEDSDLIAKLIYDGTEGESFLHVERTMGNRFQIQPTLLVSELIKSKTIIEVERDNPRLGNEFSEALFKLANRLKKNSGKGILRRNR